MCCGLCKGIGEFIFDNIPDTVPSLRDHTARCCLTEFTTSTRSEGYVDEGNTNEQKQRHTRAWRSTADEVANKGAAGDEAQYAEMFTREAHHLRERGIYATIEYAVTGRLRHVRVLRKPMKRAKGQKWYGGKRIMQGKVGAVRGHKCY